MFAKTTFLGALAMLVVAAGARGQVTDPKPIRVALVREIGNPQARALVIRQGSERDTDLIIVTNQTTAADLALAVRVAIGSRSPQRRKDPKPGADLRAYVMPALNANPPNLLVAERELARLKRSPATRIKGFGTVPNIISIVKKEIHAGT